MKTYRCIKEFCVPIFNEHGYETSKDFYINKLSIWYNYNEDYRFIGGEIRLEDKDENWIEVPNEDLKEYFEEIK